MPLSLDYSEARRRFQEALLLAESDQPLPEEWLQRTRRVGFSPNKTFVAMLGTALLAKATDERIDALALKARSGPTGYSARTLCTDVLVPSAVRAGVHLG